MLLVSTAMLLGLYLLLRYTMIGLIIKAAMENPSMVASLGHDVPRIYMFIFSLGAGLAALAGAGLWPDSGHGDL